MGMNCVKAESILDFKLEDVYAILAHDKKYRKQYDNNFDFGDILLNVGL